MKKTPRTDAAEKATMNPSYEFESAEVGAWEFARQLERELAEQREGRMLACSRTAEVLRELADAKQWIANIAPRYEALVLPHLENPVEQWPDAVIGCRTILESCPLERHEWNAIETKPTKTKQ